MRFRHRVFVVMLAVLLALGATTQAVGVEFTASDPVLYVDETPVFILENLTAKLGARRDGDHASAWLDLYGGEATALFSAISSGPEGIFAAVSGIPRAYGLSGGALAALTGAENSSAALALLSAGQFARDAVVCLDSLLEPLATGETEPLQAALLAAAAEFECRRVSGAITLSSITTAMSAQPGLRGIIAFMQAAGIEAYDPGSVSLDGMYGFSGNPGDESAVYRLAVTAGGAAYDVDLIIDNSTAITAVTINVSGDENGVEVYGEDWPDGYRSLKADGHFAGCQYEIRHISNTSERRLSADIRDASEGKSMSLTGVLSGGDFYAAISADADGVENSAYVFTDTLPAGVEKREGTVTLGLYRAGARTEICCDLEVDASARAGEGRAASPAYIADILTMTAGDWNSLADDLVNSINGAMYVLSMYVPGFTYDAIDAADFSGLLPDINK